MDSAHTMDSCVVVPITGMAAPEPGAAFSVDPSSPTPSAPGHVVYDSIMKGQMVSLCVRPPDNFADARVYTSRTSSCKIIRPGVKTIPLDCTEILCLSGGCVCWPAPQWGTLILKNCFRHPFVFVSKNL